MENNSNLYTINTATGAGTQVGTTDSNGYLTSVLLFENGTYYDGAGAGIATINVTTSPALTVRRDSDGLRLSRSA